MSTADRNETTTHLDMVRGKPNTTQPITGTAMAAVMPRFPDLLFPIQVTHVSWSTGRFDYTFKPIRGEGVGKISEAKIVRWLIHPDHNG